mmetsp:Transcript_2646/g.5509  ORF Transcript_2646/g.5509 Transcript_2646/m.5509 type:complete len:220 (-) Transcript_2646:70-729(-)
MNALIATETKNAVADDPNSENRKLSEITASVTGSTSGIVSSADTNPAPDVEKAATATPRSAAAASLPFRARPFLQPAPLPVRRAAPLRLRHPVRNRGERALGVPLRRYDDIAHAHQAVGPEYFRGVRADPRPDTDAAAQRPDHGNGAYGGGTRRGRTGDDGEDRAGCRRVVRTWGGNRSAPGSIEMKDIAFRNMVSPTPKKYIYYVGWCVQSVLQPTLK